MHASAEKNPDKVRIYRRALAGVFVAAAESGDESLSAKNYTLAKDYFQLATVAAPDSAGALKGLATALALANTPQSALGETLRRARETIQRHPAAFSAWPQGRTCFCQAASTILNFAPYWPIPKATQYSNDERPSKSANSGCRPPD